jgi:hypothetical protein
MSLTLSEVTTFFKNPFMLHAPNVQVGNMASGLSPSLFGGSVGLKDKCSYPFVQVGVGSSANGQLPIKGLYQTANYQQPPALVKDIPLYAAGGSFCPAFNAPFIPDSRFAIQPPNQDFFYI